MNLRIPISLGLFCLAILATAQDFPNDMQLDDTLVSSLDLFEGEEPLEITLRFNMKQYQRSKYKGEYQDVNLKIYIDDSTYIEKDVRIKARGNFRRSFCSIAPFWLNIRKSDVANVHLQDVKRMKVVTHCNQSNGKEAYVLKEYLIYKMYELLTPYSFRVRMVRMTYVDTGRKNKETRSWAFMIEPEDMVAERAGGTVIKNDKLGMAHMKNEDLLRMALFQYMIGNGDYSITGRHNVKLMGVGAYGQEGFTPVPYDFDYTGFVDASYAIPGDHLDLDNIRERYYLGPCREESEYLPAIALLETYRDEFLEIILSFPYISQKEKDKMADYVEAYFRSAADPGFIRNELISTCR